MLPATNHAGQVNVMSSVVVAAIVFWTHVRIGCRVITGSGGGVEPSL